MRENRSLDGRGTVAAGSEGPITGAAAEGFLTWVLVLVCGVGAAGGALLALSVVDFTALEMEVEDSFAGGSGRSVGESIAAVTPVGSKSAAFNDFVANEFTTDLSSFTLQILSIFQALIRDS